MKKFLLGFLVVLSGAALAATFSYFSPATGVLKGSASTYVTSAATSADIIGLWSGTCNSSTVLNGAGTCSAAGTPALATSDIGFGDAGGLLTGSTNLQWINSTLTLNLGNSASTAAVTVQVPNESVVAASPVLTVQAGQAYNPPAGGPFPTSGVLTLSGGNARTALSLSSNTAQNGGNAILQGGVGSSSNNAVTPFTVNGGNTIINGGGIDVIDTGAGNSFGLPGYIAFQTSPRVSSINGEVTNTLIERLRILGNGAWSVGTAGTATGTAGQILTSQGAGTLTSNTPPVWSSSASLTTLAASGAVTFPGIAASSAATTGTVCWTTATGNLTVDTTTTCLASTAKVKQNIRTLDVGLSELMRLRSVSYELKPEFDPGHLGRQVGLIAEEVNQVDPRLVGLDDNKEPRAVRYLQLTAVIVKSVQQQQLEIYFLGAWCVFLTGWIAYKK